MCERLECSVYGGLLDVKSFQKNLLHILCIIILNHTISKRSNEHNNCNQCIDSPVTSVVLNHLGTSIVLTCKSSSIAWSLLAAAGTGRPPPRFPSPCSPPRGVARPRSSSASENMLYWDDSVDSYVFVWLVAALPRAAVVAVVAVLISWYRSKIFRAESSRLRIFYQRRVSS